MDEKEGRAEVKKTFLQSVWELFRFTLLALAIVVPIRVFIAQPFIVSGSSMFPTFENEEYLIIDEVSYRLSEPRRGDVVVFRYPRDTKKFFIKRIVGLPHEVVEISRGKVTIYNEAYRDGLELEEPYIKDSSESNLSIRLGSGEYFVMGDNRNASSDSRYWGPVPEKNLIGRALLRLWPLGKIDIFPGSIHRE